MDSVLERNVIQAFGGYQVRIAKKLFWLSDAERVRAEPYMPRGRRGAYRVDDHRVISGIIHMLGGRLWVRETWCQPYAEEGNSETFYRADGEKDNSWKPAIFMPRRASRLTLPVTDVRVERVQDISEADATAEGCKPHGPGLCTENPDEYLGCHSARTDFHHLWDILNAKRGYGWDTNPWVVVLIFTAEQRNIDA